MTQATKGRRLSGCLYIIILGLRGGVFFIADLAARYPLVVIALSAAFVIGWNWRLIILLPLAFISSLLIGGSTGYYKQSIRLTRELADFHDEFQHCRFIPVGLSEYLAAMYEDFPEQINLLNEKEELRLKDSMLSDSEYFFGNHLRFIVVDNEETAGPGLGMAVAFAAMDRALGILE